MASPTNEASARSSSEDIHSTTEEQQGLLHPSPSMGSDVAKPEGRQGDCSANIVVWVCSALRPFSMF
jgi:hypothetical protein